MAFFGTGSTVEVSRDEEGAWYVARILEPHYPAKGKFLIQYQALVSDEDPSELLTQSVDISSIRPVPPPPVADQSYKPHDVVDAFHHDGWWKGTVTKVEVLEDQTRSTRYTVVLQNSHQQLHFSSPNLRFHFKWIQSPQKTEKPDRAQCEGHYADASNITKRSEVVVPVSCSSTTQDGNEELSSCKYASNETDYAAENCASEKHDVYEGTASELDFEGRQSKKAESSNMKETRGQLDGSVIVRKESHGFGQQDKGEREGSVKTFHRSAAKNWQAKREVVEQGLPFTKTSSLWKYIDSLDVFRFLPQNPHFTPLIAHNEETREGLAIGHMLFFTTLVERTSKLRVDKSRKVFDSFLEALADLETVGFDVKAVVNRVNNLLSIKARIEQLENQSECIYREIAEGEGEKAKAEEEINAIDEMISELKAKREVASSEKAMIDSERNLLQMNENRINNDISKVKLDYETQVAELGRYL